MSDYVRAIDKAIAELAMEKLLGPKHGEAALVQARDHVDRALDEALCAAAQNTSHQARRETT